MTGPRWSLNAHNFVAGRNADYRTKPAKLKQKSDRIGCYLAGPA